MRRRSRLSNLLAGVIGVVVIGIACYLVFGGSVPFSGTPYTLKAMFTSVTQLHIPSPVRIAGVEVGQVVEVKRLRGTPSSSQAALVTMHIDDNGLPIHDDATIDIRPRIFLEGNFYADLKPGSPSAPVLSSGSTLPAANTSGPVQIDRVTAALTSNARTNLQTLLSGIGSSLNAPPTPAQDATQDPSVRRLTGAQALDESLKYSVDAFRASAIVNQALLGIQPHDLSGVVRGNQEVLHGLQQSGTQLSSFVTNFNATLAALASRQQFLAQTIGVLPGWLRATNNSLGPLQRSFAPTKAFARALLPSLPQVGPTIRAALPWLAQSTSLFSNAELGGLLRDLTPAVQETSSALTNTKAFANQADQFARCLTHNLIPVGNEVIADPPVGTGNPVYQELFQSAVGLTSFSQNFDGNGRYVRSQAGGGDIRIQTASVPGVGPLFGNAVLQPLGTRPAWPGQAPPLRSGVACASNPAPDVNNVVTGGTP
jgi:phospholipid/cholesterol/gamma-HCH transport system substrate-binding protein